MRDKLYKIIKERGDRFPKKHGEWYRCHAYDDNYLLLDTWNGEIYLYPNGCVPTDTDNMYRVVYTFRDKEGGYVGEKSVPTSMYGFWYAHIRLCKH